MKTLSQFLSIIILSIIYLIFILSYPCQADWNKIKVSKGGEYNSIAIDPSGYPHVSYLDDSNPANYVLKHAYFNGHVWKTETVDSGDVGWWSAIAIDSLGHIHISYHADKPSSLKYAYFNGKSWNIILVDSDGGYSTAIALDSSNRPHITHITAMNEVHYAKYDGLNWQIETIAENALYFGNTSLALTSSGKAYVSYSNGYLPRQLFLASNSSGTWEMQNLDKGRSSSLALDSLGNPHIVYYSEDTQELKYAYYDGSAWNTYTASVLADSPHLVLDSLDLPHISLGTNTMGVECLNYAFFDGTTLDVQYLDCQNAGFYTSIALDQTDMPHISYSLTDVRGSNLLNYLYLSIADLTGQWTSLNQSCKASKTGQKCSVKGVLKIRNIGKADVKSASVRFYLSDDPSYDDGDLLLKQIATGKLKADSSKNMKLNYTFPLNGTGSQNYIIAVIDEDDAILEANENNNNIVSELIP